MEQDENSRTTTIDNIFASMIALPIIYIGCYALSLKGWYAYMKYKVVTMLTVPMITVPITYLAILPIVWSMGTISLVTNDGLYFLHRWIRSGESLIVWRVVLRVWTACILTIITWDKNIVTDKVLRHWHTWRMNIRNARIADYTSLIHDFGWDHIKCWRLSWCHRNLGNSLVVNTRQSTVSTVASYTLLGTSPMLLNI